MDITVDHAQHMHTTEHTHTHTHTYTVATHKHTHTHTIVRVDIMSISSTACFDKSPESKNRGITIDLGFSGKINKFIKKK